jgi:capsular exopolysaccharide synthesis family protein
MTEQLNGAGEPAFEVHLRDYVWVLRKHLGVAVTFFVVVVAAVTAVTFKSRPMYKATAEVYIERQVPTIVSLREMVDLSTSPDEYRKTQHQLIRSRQIVEAVFRRNKLAGHPLFADAADPVEALRELVTVTPREGTYLAVVAVESTNPAQAADWVNDILDEYLAYVELRHRTTSSEVQRSLNEEIPKLRTKLLESETKLIDFQRRENVLSFEKQQEILFQKLRDFESALTRVQKENVSLEAKLATLEALSVDGGNDGGALPILPDDLETPLIRSYRQREVALVEEFSRCQSRYLPKHWQYREVLDKLRAVRTEIRKEIGRVRRKVEDEQAVKKVETERFRALVTEQLRRIQELDARSNEYKALQAEVESNRRMYQEFRERRKELESTSGFGAMNISIVDRAIPPKAPVRPKKWLNLTLAVIVGLLGGVALAFFFEYLDDTLKSPDDIKEILGLPFLGFIPHIGRGEMEKNSGLVMVGDEFSSVAEAFRTVRTGVRFAQAPGEGRAAVLIITSPGPREGKTLNSMNLAVTLAQSDSRVLLVDADLRKPNIHVRMDLSNDRGLSTVFSDASRLDSLVSTTAVPNLWVLPSGPIPPNPSELLGSPTMDRLIDEMRASYDYVLLDTPPTGAVTDPVVLASRVDGVVLVISAGETRRRAALTALEQISRVKGRILGVVLNSFKASAGAYYRYAYYRRSSAYRAGPLEEADD